MRNVSYIRDYILDIAYIFFEKIFFLSFPLNSDFCLKLMQHTYIFGVHI